MLTLWLSRLALSRPLSLSLSRARSLSATRGQGKVHGIHECMRILKTCVRCPERAVRYLVHALRASLVMAKGHPPRKVRQHECKKEHEQHRRACEPTETKARPTPITERPHAPSGVAASMSAHSKTPCVTPSMGFPSGNGAFPSGNGAVRGRRGQQLELDLNQGVTRRTYF